jgi:hypothetical protein
VASRLACLVLPGPCPAPQPAGSRRIVKFRYRRISSETRTTECRFLSHDCQPKEMGCASVLWQAGRKDSRGHMTSPKPRAMRSFDVEGQEVRCDETDGGSVMAVRLRLLPKDGIPVWERFLSAYGRRHHALSCRWFNGALIWFRAPQSRWWGATDHASTGHRDLVPRRVRGRPCRRLRPSRT